jgi:hypothetical protein
LEWNNLIWCLLCWTHKHYKMLWLLEYNYIFVMMFCSNKTIQWILKNQFDTTAHTIWCSTTIRLRWKLLEKTDYVPCWYFLHLCVSTKQTNLVCFMFLLKLFVLTFWLNTPNKTISFDVLFKQKTLFWCSVQTIHFVSMFPLTTSHSTQNNVFSKETNKQSKHNNLFLMFRFNASSNVLFYCNKRA